jgi:hypothetical protein
MKGGVVLLELDHSIGIKRSCRGRNYVLQNVLILMAVRRALCRGAFYPLHVRSIAYSEQTQNVELVITELKLSLAPLTLKRMHPIHHVN